ncbi:hypothetical protein NMG60_11030619 [Bertholletia excelsa]
MGNCLFGGGGDANEVIRVVTWDGGIMEFTGPITVESIADEFPGQGIFRSQDLFWNPLPRHQVLLAGESYYLLPLNSKDGIGGQIAKVGHVRSNSLPSSFVAPYRMSFDGQVSGSMKTKMKMKMMKRASYADPDAEAIMSSRYSSSIGIWKVKLIISPRQLLEILSQETRTQELIESVRTVAKCGNIGFGVQSLGFSDQWSLSTSSSSRNAAASTIYNKDCLLEY